MILRFDTKMLETNISRNMCFCYLLLVWNHICYIKHYYTLPSILSKSKHIDFFKLELYLIHRIDIFSKTIYFIHLSLNNYLCVLWKLFRLIRIANIAFSYIMWNLCFFLSYCIDKLKYQMIHILQHNEWRHTHVVA